MIIRLKKKSGFMTLFKMLKYRLRTSAFSTKGKVLLSLLLVLTGCSSMDCPLNDTVYTKYRLAGPVRKLSDTLTISTTRIEGSDSVIINQDVNVDSFMLPMSYTQPQDIFFFNMTDTLGTNYRDTIIVSKDNQPHFESIDCGPSFFHTITGISHTYNAIDSIVINNKKVTYDATKPHFIIYFREHN